MPTPLIGLPAGAASATAGAAAAGAGVAVAAVLVVVASLQAASKVAAEISVKSSLRDEDMMTPD
jgi:hypothetical protein